MIEAFSAYIKTIAVFIIFSAFAEIVMPNENFKKYIHIVIGFLMIVIVLKPITTVLGKGGVDFTNIIEKKEVNDPVGQMQQQDELKYEALENEYLLSIYKQNMIDKITNDMKQQEIYIDTIFLIIGEGENNFGELLEIQMTISDKNKKQNNSALEVIPVSPVNIKQEENQKDVSMESKVIEILETQYHIASESIHITVQ